MKTGFVLPRGDARTAAEFAREAEAAGWDGFFVWDDTRRQPGAGGCAGAPVC